MNALERIFGCAGSIQNSKNSNKQCIQTKKKKTFPFIYNFKSRLTHNGYSQQFELYQKNVSTIMKDIL